MIDLLVTLCSMVLAFVMFVVLFFVMHWNLLICMGLAIVLYFALTLLLKPTERIGGVKISSLENGEELKDRLGEAKAEYGRIQKAAERITDFELQKRSLQLQDRAGNILHYLFVDMNRFAELIRNGVTSEYRSCMVKYLWIPRIRPSLIQETCLLLCLPTY